MNNKLLDLDFFTSSNKNSYNKLELNDSITSTDIKKISDSDDIHMSEIDNDFKKYNIAEKKIIASRIEQINNKKIYIKLFKIIYADNNNYTTNTNGVFLNLNNVHDKTLFKIEKVLNMYEEIKKNRQTKNTWLNEINIGLNTDMSNIDNKYTNDDKLYLKKTNINNINLWQP
jgi:hypothetical protein